MPGHAQDKKRDPVSQAFPAPVLLCLCPPPPPSPVMLTDEMIISENVLIGDRGIRNLEKKQSSSSRDFIKKVGVRFVMETQQIPLSSETLAQFNHTQAAEAGALLRRQVGSVSTHRSSQSGDPRHSRPAPQLMLKAPEGSVRPPGPSRQSSVISNPNSPFLRRESLLLSKRLSLTCWAPSGLFSFSGFPLLQPVQEVRLENSYRTRPEEGCRFDPDRVQRILQAALDGYLADVHYNPATSAQLAQNLSDLLRSKAKDATPPRYRIVCLVVLGQPGSHSLKVASRCLWDTENDSTAVAVLRNPSLFAVAIVYGVY
ncbi:hypothetical protein JZ751_025711, partial [Albula glossodonta]